MGDGDDTLDGGAGSDNLIRGYSSKLSAGDSLVNFETRDVYVTRRSLTGYIHDRYTGQLKPTYVTTSQGWEQLPFNSYSGIGTLPESETITSYPTGGTAPSPVA